METLNDFEVLCPCCLRKLHIVWSPIGWDLMCMSRECPHYKDKFEQYKIPLMKRGKHEPQRI